MVSSIGQLNPFASINLAGLTGQVKAGATQRTEAAAIRGAESYTMANFSAANCNLNRPRPDEGVGTRLDIG